jgi:hypothetical protein
LPYGVAPASLCNSYTIAFPSISILYAVPAKYPAGIGISALAEYQGRARSGQLGCGRQCMNRKEQTMLDLIFLVGGVGFFVLAIAYAYACDRL